MDIKIIPLTQLEMDLRETLNECADSGEPLFIELPDRRIVAMQPLPSTDDDSLIDELLASNPAFQALVEKSKTSPPKPFTMKLGN